MAGTEKFDYDGVKTKMADLEGLFTRFADKLQEVNMRINEEVCVSFDSAIYGETGLNLLNTWNENAATFSDFKANFDKWSQLVTVISMNNMELEGELFRTTGSNLTGVQDRRSELKTEANNAVISQSEIVLSNGNKQVTVVTGQGTTVTTYNSQGKAIKVETTVSNADGSTITILKTGACITTTVIGASGSKNQVIEYSSGYTKIIDEEGNIQYFNSNGREISKRDFESNYSGGGNLLENEENYSSNPDRTTYTSVVGKISGDAKTIIATGAAFQMSRGTQIVGKDGKTYYFYGIKDNGTMYVCDTANGDLSKMHWLNNDGTVSENYVPQSAMETVDDKIASTARVCNPGYEVSKLVSTSGDSNWAVSEQYIKAVDGTVVSNTSDVSGAIANKNSFTLADGKKLIETDWDDTTSNADTFYNLSHDTGKADYHYYSDENNSGIIMNGEKMDQIHKADKAWKKASNNGNDNKGGPGKSYIVVE